MGGRRAQLRQEYLNWTHSFRSIATTLDPGFDPTMHLWSLEQMMEYDDDEVDPHLSVIDSDDHDYAEGDFVSENFFPVADLMKLLPLEPVENWTAANCHQAQRVLPAIFLGPASASNDPDFLIDSGITLLLAIHCGDSARYQQDPTNTVADYIGIDTFSIDAVDDADLVTVFPLAIRRINDHLDGTDSDVVHTLDEFEIANLSHRKVLVFCETGNHYSACVVTAYLMAMLNKGRHVALSIVVNRRNSVEVTDSMMRMLSEFDKILSNMRDVERARHARELISETTPKAQQTPTPTTEPALPARATPERS